MIIGTAKLDFEALKEFEGRPEDLIAYVDSMVPTWARHIRNITNNQRFYVAIHLRKVLTLPYKVRAELVEALVKDIHISGVVSQFTPIEELVQLCDKDKLVLLLKEGDQFGG